jgi:hypothetical protein
MSADANRPTPVPSAFEVRELFEGLLGRTVEWTAMSGVVDPIDGATIGAYTNDFGVVKALVLCDIALTARAGSAIALLPQMSAEDTIKNGLVTAAQFDNLAEILNVAGSMFNRPNAPHIRLDTTYAPRETLPPDVAKWTLVPASRIDGVLTIQGYGEGRISVVVAY